MMTFEVDLHGVYFTTRAGLPGFIERGALQDRAGLPDHRWPAQGPAFKKHADEIEAFAHVLAASGQLVDGVAFISAKHVKYC